MDATMQEPMLRGDATPLEIAADSQTMQRNLHHRLLLLNHHRLEPAVPTDGSMDDLQREAGLRRLEHRFIMSERRAVAHLAAQAPTDPDAFLAWFEDLRAVGPGQNDPLFPWLSERATVEQMRWFLRQEVAGEAGFDDLVAWTQVKMPVQVKLEMARNYWDEMGRGRQNAMHGPMLAQLAAALEVSTAIEIDRLDSVGGIVWEALALANLLCGLAANRHYAYHSVGALGVIELTAPGRAHAVNIALRRLGLSASVRRYYAVHATLDIEHSRAWNREVIRPLVARDPHVSKWVAEGALMRLRAGERCFARYRAALWY